MDLTLNFKNGPLRKYLSNGMKVLLLFNDHGMGDCVMFMPLYRRLKQMFPEVVFNLQCGKGQNFFQELTETKYDLKYYIKFPEFNMEGIPLKYPYMSKVGICCVMQLGIPPEPSLQFTYKFPEVPFSGIPLQDNSIGIAFQVTSNPNKSVPQKCAEVVWNTVKEFGYTPIEVHFQHPLKNSRNTKYSFIDRTCRDYPASVEACVDVIRRCKGFIGVNTGTFCMATALKNKKVLHMFKRWPFYPYYIMYQKLPEIDCREVSLIDKNKIKDYLESLN